MRLELDGSVTSRAQNRTPANATIFQRKHRTEEKQDNTIFLKNGAPPPTRGILETEDPNQEPAEATAMSAHEQKMVASGREFFFGTKYLRGDVRILSLERD